MCLPLERGPAVTRPGCGFGLAGDRLAHDMPYGRVAVFKDLYGNLWDLVQRVAGG